MRPDLLLLALARVIRMFAYGGLAVILALYLAAIGYDTRAIGVLFTLTLVGDALVSFLLTTTADRFGRRRTLVVGSILMVAAGVVFSRTTNWTWLVTAAIVGVISPTGNETGPFLSVEQAGLTELVPGAVRTHVFARYQVASSFAGALGALAAGAAVSRLSPGIGAVEAYRWLFLAYAAAGLLLAALFLGLSAAVEPAPRTTPRPLSTRFGLHRSRGVVARIAALFALDSFGGGFVLQSLIAYWFHLKFGASEASLGRMLFACNLVAGLTSLGSAWIAKHIGLVRTMVATHLPSNVLLCLVPIMPTYRLAVAVLILRFSISQMDVPTRQSYVVALVDPDERSAANGITAIARSIGAAVSPAISGLLLAAAPAAPFFAAGGLKIVYDLLLFRSFRSHAAPEERPR